MDEIPDAEYKVVEHQIAPPLGPSSAKVQCRAHVAPNWTYVVGRSAALMKCRKRGVAKSALRASVMVRLGFLELSPTRKTIPEL